MARQDEYKAEDRKLTALLVITAALAVWGGYLIDSKAGTIFFGMIAGIALTFGSASFAMALGYDGEVERCLCPHHSCNTMTDARGDVYHFCDDCGEQLSATPAPPNV